MMKGNADHPDATLSVNGSEYHFYALDAIPGFTRERLLRMPYSLRVLLEGVFRAVSERKADPAEIELFLDWPALKQDHAVLPFFPGRVIMQDFSGIPVLNDLAGLRAALARAGVDPRLANPVIPVDLVVDHSIQVDVAGKAGALEENTRLEFERNRERYAFLRWCSQAFDHLRIVPPASGIIHQVNLELLAPVVQTMHENGSWLAFPDTVIGTDSHTTMINGLGVLGWGVGGIEAAAAMLGEPIEIPFPKVIGVRLTGRLPEGTTPTDLTLTLTQLLRRHGVVDRFVEFFGSGLDVLSLADRAMVANMAPENGATALYFPVDEQTLEYLRFTGRSAEQTALVEAYCRRQYLLRTPDAPDPAYEEVLEVDLGSITPSLAGPKRPQDRVPLSDVKRSFYAALTAPASVNGYGLDEAGLEAKAEVSAGGRQAELRHGAVVLASITSCTNTSNPFVMMAAGLLAKKAVEKGLRVPAYVKTSLAPGSRVVSEYLCAAGLETALEELGFHTVAYGCTTCIGNSGPLMAEVVEAIQRNRLVAAAVLSGNRNFEGRVSPHTRANYLASPPLVVAYALAGRLDLDLTSEPLGRDHDGKPVFLRDLWPSTQEIHAAMAAYIHPEQYRRAYGAVEEGNAEWQSLQSVSGDLFTWQSESTYLQEPLFFFAKQRSEQVASAIKGARVLVWVGDSTTTDHISPAGSIPATGPAGEYLISHGVAPADFNAYGTRRGNDRVMARGTFANIRLKNRLVPGVEGGVTRCLPGNEVMTIFEASRRYRASGTPLVVLAGKEYGTGSSRDWAAKGPMLLGVKAILAESYERIHRSNLAEMGILPLQFRSGENAASLGLNGEEVFDIELDDRSLEPRAEVGVCARRADGSQMRFCMILRLDTANEIRYFRNGGILNSIFLQLREEHL